MGTVNGERHLKEYRKAGCVIHGFLTGIINQKK
jgi:hypothetical protein